MSDMWNGVAPGWEANAQFVDAHLEAATERMLDAAHVAEGAHVLDLGTGPGGAGLAAARRVGPAGRVVLSDVATEMVAVAARRAEGLPQVSTAVFDQTAISAPDGTFDAVLIRHGLMFAEDPVAAVREAVRVLRPGGHYAAVTWGRRAENPWLGLILDAVSSQFGVPFPPLHVPGPFALDTPEAMIATLRAAGLQDVVAETLPTPMRESSLGAWWGRVPQLAGPLALALAGMEPDVRAAIAARAAESAAAVVRHEGDEVLLDGSVVVAAGRRGHG